MEKVPFVRDLYLLVEDATNLLVGRMHSTSQEDAF
jgi:hypothetical protein